MSGWRSSERKSRGGRGMATRGSAAMDEPGSVMRAMSEIAASFADHDMSLLAGGGSANMPSAAQQMLAAPASKARKGAGRTQKTVKAPADRKRGTKRPRSESGPHKCYICQKTFDKSGRLSRHMETHKKNDERTKYTCSVPGCGKQYLRLDHLKRHQITHNGVKPFVCPGGKAFFYHYHLLRHERSGCCKRAAAKRRKDAIEYSQATPNFGFDQKDAAAATAADLVVDPNEMPNPGAFIEMLRGAVEPHLDIVNTLPHDSSHGAPTSYASVSGAPGHVAPSSIPTSMGMPQAPTMSHYAPSMSMHDPSMHPGSSIHDPMHPDNAYAQMHHASMTAGPLCVPTSHTSSSMLNAGPQMSHVASALPGFHAPRIQHAPPMHGAPPSMHPPPPLPGMGFEEGPASNKHDDRLYFPSDERLKIDSVDALGLPGGALV